MIKRPFHRSQNLFLISKPAFGVMAFIGWRAQSPARPDTDRPAFPPQRLGESLGLGALTGLWTKMAAVVNYSPPWWVNLLHRLPHFNLEFQIVSSDFRPEDSEYQKVRRAPEEGIITSHSECVMVGHHLMAPSAACPHGRFAAERPNGGEDCPQTTKWSGVPLHPSSLS